MTLEEIEERWKWSPIEDITWLISRVKELENGIRKHKNTEIGSNYRVEQMENRDEALYKLLEK